MIHPHKKKNKKNKKKKKKSHLKEPFSEVIGNKIFVLFRKLCKWFVLLLLLIKAETWFLQDELRRRRNEESVGSENNASLVARGSLFSVPHSPSVHHCWISEPPRATLHRHPHILPCILIRHSHSHHLQPRHSRRRHAWVLPRTLRHHANPRPRHVHPVASRARAALQGGHRRGGGAGRIRGGPALASLRPFGCKTLSVGSDSVGVRGGV